MWSAQDESFEEKFFSLKESISPFELATSAEKSR